MAQFVYLVHHADALPARADHLRPLSPRGEQQATRVAEAAAARGARPTVIWHSGKLRARQTAEAWLSNVNSAATLIAVPGLQPEDDPEIAATMLVAEEADVAIASHMPFLPALLHRLTSDRRDGMSAPFPLNGCVALERVGARFEERWRVSPLDGNH